VARRYVKLWEETIHDSYFISLNGVERGTFLQLIIHAGEQGGSGNMFFRNYYELGSRFGSDPRTIKRHIEKFAKDGKIVLLENSKKYIEVYLTNFIKNQQVKSPKGLVNSKNDEKPVKLQKICNSAAKMRDFCEIPTTQPTKLQKPENSSTGGNTPTVGGLDPVLGDKPPNTIYKTYKVNKSNPNNKATKRDVDNFLIMWHTLLPFAGKILMMTSTREENIKRRLNEFPDLVWWESLMKNNIAKSRFLRGEVVPAETSGHRQFKLMIDWLMKPINLVKVVEGNYLDSIIKKDSLDALRKITEDQIGVAK